jgi:tRNA G46 methylase TrmB
MRIRQHVNPLKSNFFTIAPGAVQVAEGVPLEVELGSAEAWFLMDRARTEPGGRYVGVESACSPTCRSICRGCSRPGACGGSS